jgi:D-sedoheptulose 7-phosphate isomerase
MTADHDIARRGIEESAEVIRSLLAEELLAPIVAAADLVGRTIEDGGKLLLFGNGGSATDAAHIATELVGRFLHQRRAVPALSLSESPSALTAIANDFGFEGVFARQVEAFGVSGDAVMAISTSGDSANVLAGARAARERELAVIALTGEGGGRLAAESDILIAVHSRSTPRIQEAHALIAHAICELVERRIT